MSEPIGLLSPQSCKPIRLGGLVNLTPADLSHACMNASKIGFAIICIKYGSDSGGLSSLVNALYRKAERDISNEHWKRSRIPMLVRMAVIEYCGDKVINNKQRAECIGVHPSTFSRVWQSRYMRLMDILETAEQSTLHLVKKRLQ